MGLTRFLKYNLNSSTMKFNYFPLLLLSVFVFCVSAAPSSEENPEAVLGVWRRLDDGLVIQISGDISTKEGATSRIDSWAKWEFPCTAAREPFYKRIRWQAKESYWSCDFLVYEMDDCYAKYNTRGQVRILEDGTLEIFCPGFPTRYFEPINPRLLQK